jgi:3-oxoacyl-[acyl-carrier protein] reductase
MDLLPSLAGHVVVVTGGGGGIGSVICRRFAEAGAAVVITELEAAKAQAVADALPGTGHLGIAAPVDDSAALRALAAEIALRYGRLDVLVNCAAFTRRIPHDDLDALDDETIDAIFRVNWRGAFACVRALRGLLAQGDGGLVVNISSMSAFVGYGSNVAYCASKAALNSMTQVLARALAPAIRVVAIAPGWVDGEYARRLDPAILDEQRRRTPLGRLATSEDVADAVLATATLLRFTTGAIITVDGGRAVD